MPRRDFFPATEGLSSLISRSQPRTDTDYLAEDVARDAAAVQMQRDVNQSMEGLLDMRRKAVLGEMQQLGIRQAASLLPIVSSLDPTADDYDAQLSQAIAANPYGAQDPAVKSILGIHGDSRKEFMTVRNRAAEVERQRADQETNRLTALRAQIASRGTDSLSRYDKGVADGLDPFESAAQVSSVDDSQEAYSTLAAAGLAPEAIEALKDPKTGLIDKVRAQAVLADYKKSQVPDDVGRYATRVANSLRERQAKAAAEVTGAAPLTPEEEAQLAELEPIAQSWVKQSISALPKPGAPAASPSGKPTMKFDLRTKPPVK